MSKKKVTGNMIEILGNTKSEFLQKNKEILIEMINSSFQSSKKPGNTVESMILKFIKASNDFDKNYIYQSKKVKFKKLKYKTKIQEAINKYKKTQDKKDVSENNIQYKKENAA